MDRHLPLAVLFAALAATACPPAGPAPQPPAPTTPDAAPEPEVPTTGDTSIADTIVADWDGLLALSRAVYLATWTVETSAEGFNVYRMQPLRRFFGPEDELPATIGTTAAAVVGGPSPGYPWPAPDEAAWVVTGTNEDGDEVILTAAPEPCGSIDCATAPPREQLVQNLRCGQLSRLWYTMPDAATSCSADTDCVALTAMCFEVALRADKAAPYQEVLLRHGGVCLHPAAGACPTFPVRAECRDGRCTAVR